MTGYGAVEGAVGSSHLSVEVRSVNHRYLNSTLRLPADLSKWDSEVRELLRSRLARGHVTLTVRFERDAEAPFAIDEARFAAGADLLRRLRDRHFLDGPIDVASVLRLPDVLGAPSDISESTGRELLTLVGRALDSLNASKEGEGARLRSFLLDRLQVIELTLSRIASRAPERLIEQRDRLRQNVRELSEGIAVDEQRIAMEIAILADRLDVQEELARFRAHIAAFREAVEKGSADGVGKRLGFLLQEMLREANTTGSKASDSAIVAEVVTIKEELERVREQVENIE